MPDPTQRRPAGLTETAASLAALLLILLTAWTGFGVHLCLETPCDAPDAGEILAYRFLVAVLAIVVLATVVLAVRRRARWALLWHLVVAFAAVATAVLFAVPQIDVSELRQPEPPEPNPHYVPCRSGSNDCARGGG